MLAVVMESRLQHVLLSMLNNFNLSPTGHSLFWPAGVVLALLFASAGLQPAQRVVGSRDDEAV